MNELLVFGGAVLLSIAIYLNLISLIKLKTIENFLNEVIPAPQSAQVQTEERISEISKQYGLSDKEREIARQLYNGKNNYEIAEAMSVAENTVKSHNYRLYKKLGVENRVQAVNLIREGIKP